MDLESIDRREKLSATKLHVSQYVVAAVLVVLGCWLWRLADPGGGPVSRAGGTEPGAQGSGAGAARGEFLIGMGGYWWITIRR